MLSEVYSSIVDKLLQECHAFYGDVDFIPTVQYKLDDTERAYRDAGFVVEIAGKAIGKAEKK